MQVSQEYSEESVEFVSITSDDQPSVEAFVKEYQIPWPCAFRASADTLEQFGVMATSVLGTREINRYIKPTLFLVNSKGKIVWFDNHGRYRHRAAEEICEELRTVLDSHLSRVNRRPRPRE